MEKKVNRKNIAPLLVDVKRPGFAYGAHTKKATVNLARGFSKKNSFRIRRFNPRFAITLVASLFFVGCLVAGGIYGMHGGWERRGETVAANFKEALASLETGDFTSAQAPLERNEVELAALSSFLNTSAGSFVANTVGSVVPAVSDGKALIGEIVSLNFNLLKISRIADDVKKNGFRYFRSDGGKLLEGLGELRTRLASVSENMHSVRGTAGRLKALLPFLANAESFISNASLGYDARFYEFDRVLGRVISLLGDAGERHILVFFQNTSEIRPGGGFIGSYADVTVSGGAMKNMDVRDIYDPDGQLAMKFTPPAPLQTMTQDWGARDANWFFDFPTSAATVLTMIERSGMYMERGVTFEGAVALNINVFRSLMKAAGPVELPEYKLTVNEDNFLAIIQREVEAGKDKIAGYPKRILTVLAPILMERMEKFEPAQITLLLDDVQMHADEKDIMLYAKDDVLEQFITSSGFDGGVYGLPKNFWGSYLAVVNANVAGGKSDAFMEERIVARVDVAADGATLTDLSVTRAHRGDKEKDPWWRATNKNYMQVLTNPAAELLSLKGNDAKNLVSDFNYQANGYQTLSALYKIESTKKFLAKWNAWVMDEFGKTAFATWSFINAGKTKTLEFRYQTPSQTDVVRAGGIFTFVFERQSGVKSPLEITFAAPVGYVWKESGDTRFVYKNENPEKREMITLTLAK